MSSAALTADLQTALKSVLGERLAKGEEAHRVDGLLPYFAASPSTVEEMADVLAAADEVQAAVIPLGGRQHIELGNVPLRYDIALSTTRLNRVIEYEPADLTITIEAGMAMGNLQALLGERGQFLPIDAPRAATVGGVLAAGVSGPSRHAYGIPRDWLLGTRIVHAGGGVSKGGGRVVKNVAGYDLPKLAVGSLGTLGVIVEVSLKLAPLPAVQETLLAKFADSAAAAEAIFEASDRGLAIRAVALVDGSTAAFWLGGPGSAVRRTARDLDEITAGTETERLEDAASDAWWAQFAERSRSTGRDVDLQASLPMSKVTSFIERLAELAGEAPVEISIISYVTTGLVIARLSGGNDQLASVIDRARTAAGLSMGSLVVTAAPPSVKERIDVWGDVGDAAVVMQRLKQEFDPHGTLSPGRYVAGL